MATRKIETELALSGEKEFNSAMKSANNEMKNLSAEMNASSAAFKDQEGSVRALSDKDRILTAQIEQQKEKVAALSSMHQKAVQAYGADSAAADKYKQQLLNSEAALSKMEEAQKDNNIQLHAAKNPVNRAKEAYNQLKKGLDDLRKKYPALDAAIKGTEAVLKGSAKAIGGLTAAGAAATAAMTVFAVKGLKQLSQYAVDAAKNGDPAFAGLAANLEKLNASSAKAKGALGGLVGPMLEKLSGQGSALLTKFSEELDSAGGDPEAVAAALEHLITRGASMLKANLPEISKLATNLVSGLAGGIGAAAPELVDAGVEVATTLLDTIIDNAPTIAAAGTDLISQLLLAIITSAPELLDAGLEIVTTLVEGLADNSEDIGQSAVELVEALVVGIVTNAPELVKAAGKLVLGLLKGLWNGLVELYPVAAALVQALKDKVREKAEDLLEAGKELIQKLIDGFLEKLEKAKDLGQEVIDKIKEGIREKWEELKQWFRGLWDGLFGNLTANVNLNGSAGGGGGGTVNGSFAKGLDYVPYDGFIAELHKGERVLTAAENEAFSRSAMSAGTTINVYAQSLNESEVSRLYNMINDRMGVMA